ncbi:oxygen-independent coproporphyrinogen III oxidase [Rubellimicrobium sp. CFH 75288]|uniref:oxygen-independent coproporphyrinogen III oxidase n=1 Tax=Rubellimicrobium sp. CFH 75288 TaxID=2697034 RepID=UPI0014131AA1|nr:oxygen-independent coproporphyrinogen III oxidase [Rubellimicrobium sp. CFH 75288]NAZ36727.1 oxygen-independent coproporphyrinogen III oxidase [Rubellimicrobium sp. CFH 75288]
MTTQEDLRDLGLLDARAPRYTSYPPANHFGPAVGPDSVAEWLRAVPRGTRVSLYVHVPYCRRLCWFCACRTQGTATDRPLGQYLDRLLRELDLVGRHLPPEVEVTAIHLGGGTPTILPPDLLGRLCAALRAFRPVARDLSLSVEIDPTEVDPARLDALAEAGMTRASIGVQDFDPLVQEAIGRIQPFDLTREVVGLIRGAGVRSLNMDLLFGLPHQTRARLADSVAKVLALGPDRVALYGYAHVPWMAKRQAMIPADALPGAEERLALFEAAARLFVWDGYEEIGIDHFARPGDALAQAAREGRMRRNFQGYTEDGAEVLIGLGASAISRYPQGYAQNAPTSSLWAAAVEAGRLPTERGHRLSAEDRLRADLIEQIMCRFAIDLPATAARHGLERDGLRLRLGPVLERLRGWAVLEDDRLRLVRSPRLVARLAAQALDTYAMPEGRHSRAL